MTLRSSFDCVLLALSSENSGLPGEQEEAEKTWVNNCFATRRGSKQSRSFVDWENPEMELFSYNVNGGAENNGLFCEPLALRH